MTLIGVKPYNADDLLLNPGVDHILMEDDTVYYIAYASEKNTKIKGLVKRHALNHACATCATIMLATCGINPFEMQQMDSNNAKKAKEAEKTGSESKPNSCDSSSMGTYSKSLDGKSRDPSLLEGDDLLPEIVPASEESHLPSPLGSPSPIGEDPETQQKNDAIRGVQLLRFHSMENPPPIKVNVLHPKDPIFQWPSPAISAGSSASNTPTPSIISSHRPRKTASEQHQKLLMGRQRKNSLKSHLDAPSMVLTGQEQDFTSNGVKYSARGAPNLSNLIEDPLLESGSRVNTIEPCQISITLEESTEDPIVGVRRKTSVPLLHKPHWIKRQFSVPSVSGSSEIGVKKHSKNSAPSSDGLLHAEVSEITRWASDSKLKKTENDGKPPHLHLTQDLESGRLNMRNRSGVGEEQQRMDIALCLSDQNLLTPTSFKKHEMQSHAAEPASHALFHRRSTSLFRGIHRRRSSHAVEEVKVQDFGAVHLRKVWVHVNSVSLHWFLFANFHCFTDTHMPSFISKYICM